MKAGDRLLVILIIIAAAAFYFFNNFTPVTADKKVAVIEVNNRVFKKIDLDRVVEPYEFKIEQSGGRYNIIRVEKGKIRMIEANCPNKLGIKAGWLTKPGEMAVCLPFKVVIKIIGEEDGPGIDGVSY